MAHKKRKKRASTADTPMSYTPDKNATIKKAKNGFVVSSYGPKGECTYIAKTKKEAKDRAAKLLG